MSFSVDGLSKGLAGHGNDGSMQSSKLTMSVKVETVFSPSLAVMLLNEAEVEVFTAVSLLTNFRSVFCCCHGW